MTSFRSIRLRSGLTAILLTFGLAGCAFFPSTVETVQPAPVPPPPAAAVAEPVDIAPAPPLPPAPSRPKRTVVLLSDDIPEFATIAAEIEARADNDNLTILNLDGTPLNIPRVKTEAEGADQIIAIGLLAATVGLEIESKQLVFCQVYNYRDYDLLSATSKGVSLLPPFDLQLDHWTRLDPDLRSVGIITGPNQEDLVEEARAAAERHGIDLSVRNVSSDKEALYTFRLLTPEIQGLWMLPDNRILSPEVVREIMAYSARHRKGVVVFGANLLSLGGLMSMTADAGDVAEQALRRLRQISANGNLAGPEMSPLTKVRVEVNPEIARHLGLSIPEALASSIQR